MGFAPESPQNRHMLVRKNKATILLITAAIYLPQDWESIHIIR